MKMKPKDKIDKICKIEIKCCEKSTVQVIIAVIILFAVIKLIKKCARKCRCDCKK